MDTDEKRIRIGPGTTPEGALGVCLIIPPGCTITVEGGGKEIGVVMPSLQAKEIAYALLLHATQLDGLKVSPDKPGAQSLAN